MCRPVAQVAELVDALVSGTSGASREGSSPFLGTIILKSLSMLAAFSLSCRKDWRGRHACGSDAVEPGGFARKAFGLAQA